MIKERATRKAHKVGRQYATAYCALRCFQYGKAL